MQRNVRVPALAAPVEASGALARLRLDFFAGLLGLGLLAIAVATLASAGSLPDLRTPDGSASLANGSLSFIPNEDQVDQAVRYYAQGPGFGFFFTRDEAVLAFERKESGHALQLRFLGASSGATLVPERRGDGKVNYIRGSDPSRWQTGLPTYEQLTYRKLWPGVNMSFRGTGGQLKYEFRLSAGANPDRIRLAYAGAEGLSVSSGGSLLIRTPQGTLHDSAPRAWQWIDGRRVAVDSRYSLTKGNRGYGFALGAYDPRHPLVIDPGIRYSTYLGGSSVDIGEAITVDSAGDAYVTGRADSTGFPTTPGAFDTSHDSSSDSFVTKLSEDGSTLVYSTFLGGSGSESGYGITVDASGSAHVTGDTSSSDFPTTSGVLDTTLSGNDDAFVTKLSPDGSALSYSTYLGGSGNIDSGNAITLDGSGNAYITGETISTDFPTTPGAFDTTPGSIYEAFVTKLDPAGASLVYSTYLGGGGTFDHGHAIEVDGSGKAYVSGTTSSTNFPTTMGALDTTHNGDDDAFVTKLAADGSALEYSTFIGGNTFDGSSGIALGPGGVAYLSGSTSSNDFPSTPGAYDTTYNSDGDAWVAKLNATGTALTYSTFLGGTGAGTTGADFSTGIAVDGSGRAHVTGRTDSALFPTTADAFDPIYGPVGDAFYTELNAAGSGLVYSTYLGGLSGGLGSDQGSDIALDDAGDAYIVGYTTTTDFPTTANAYDTSANGSNDVFITKIGASGYARPRAATPVLVRFVPAYAGCGSANASHGPPLSSPSCSPPDPESNYLTLGTPDANGNPPNSNGHLQFKVLGESPINHGNGDQADVQLTFSFTDVRNASDFSDYTGELRAVVTLRMTDRYNGATLADPATVSDVSFSFAVPCSPTPGPAVGSTCSVTTTADSLTTDTVREGKRAIWELGQAQVFDGGADGDADTVGDNTRFAVQGLFTP
jgi:hypothetical protein